MPKRVTEDEPPVAPSSSQVTNFCEPRARFLKQGPGLVLHRSCIHSSPPETTCRCGFGFPCCARADAPRAGKLLLQEDKAC